MKALDAADETLQDRRLAWGELEVSINVEGTKAGEVGLNRFWLQPAGAEACNPLHDGAL